MKKHRLMFWSGIAAAVVIFVLVNVFMTMLVKKTLIKIDLTTDDRYELTNATYDYLKTYDCDTTVYILASVTDQDTNTRAVIDRYAAANSRIAIKNVDINENPAFGREFVKNGETLNENAVIVSSGDRYRVLEDEDLYATEDGSITGLNAESKLTSALKYVSSSTITRAYFTTGHDELELTGAEQALESENYEISDINTLTEEIPQDASVVIAARPLRDFTTAEIAKLDAYLSDGGAVEIFLDSECDDLANISAFCGTRGIGIGDGIVAETADSTITSGSTYIFLMNYVKNDVTEKIISEGVISAYKPFAKPLSIVAAQSGIEVSEYLSSTDESYVTTNLDNPVKSAADYTGATSLALMSESEQGGRLYVSGTVMLLNYEVEEINSAGFANAEYFTALTDNMSGAGDAFVVPVKTLGAARLVMSDTAKRVMLAITVIAIPLLLIACGTAVFLRRRNM